MESADGQYDIRDHFASYRSFDNIGQKEIKALAQSIMLLRDQVQERQSDLDDERNLTCTWKRRAEEAEASISRSQFVLMLIDGNGYHFKEAFLKATLESGGFQAAQTLRDEILNHIESDSELSGIDGNGDLQIMVNIYANRAGLAKTMYETGIVYSPTDLDKFFCDFSQSQTLFQFVDCSYGKNRVHAKIRDIYRFYAYNTQCRHIFLACTHDEGYVAELDRYRVDNIARPKTTLVHAAQSPAASRAFSSLPFASVRFGTVFETSAIEARAKAQRQTFQVSDDGDRPQARSSGQSSVGLNKSANNTIASPSTVLAGMPVHSAEALPPAQAEPNLSTKAAEQKLKGDIKNGIPINRSGQRIDLKIRQPSPSELARFERRIGYRKLCTGHHLRDNCDAYSCNCDHDPVDAAMKHTLRYRIRNMPCRSGSKCRRRDCFYGHQCRCGNAGRDKLKCAFLKNGLHDIRDMEIERFVEASAN